MQRKINLILDWDGTLTRKDTLHLVAKIGYDKHDIPLDSSTFQYQPPARSWSSISQAYLDKLAAHTQAYKPDAPDRRRLADERAWLASLRDVEIYGATTAEHTGLFKGIVRADVTRAAKHALGRGELDCRTGWEELLDAVIRSGGTASVLSVNWSGAFIRKALLAGLQGSSASLAEYVQREMVVHANEIQGLGGADGSTGSLRDENGDVRTSRDKLLRLPERCQRNLDSIPTRKECIEEDDSEMVVYVGDSDTDLECLLAADVGVVMRDTPMGSGQAALASTLSRLGIKETDIKYFDPSVASEGGSVWITGDLEQVRRALWK